MLVLDSLGSDEPLYFQIFNADENESFRENELLETMQNTLKQHEQQVKFKIPGHKFSNIDVGF